MPDAGVSSLDSSSATAELSMCIWQNPENKVITFWFASVSGGREAGSGDDAGELRGVRSGREVRGPAC